MTKAAVPCRLYFVNKTFVLAFVCLFFLVRPAAAIEGVHFESGRTQNTLVELYTSDASRDCNEALQWMNALKSRDTLWQRFVPVQMHVSYWDGGGAKDTFALKVFDGYLLQHKKIWQASHVYAPTMVVNGIEWSGWSRGQEIPRGLPAEVGNLSIDSTKRENIYSVIFIPSKKLRADDFTVHAVLMGFGLRSMSSDGENRGRPLTHDFVALTHQQLSFRNVEGLLTAEFEINGKKIMKAEKYAAVFWVTSENDVRPIQTTGGFIKLL
jgi:hypothetical protein